ncbi:MAG: hypothetical protein GWO39_14875, partial [Gammaproteobacteria bacterium]|nr:hypothetical protein [Gammaproteobacteria bacterium]NIT64981.1 hypothetical protein [Gammaproteobacteria bacterium]NIV22000.1 hypothetical protein [Gammaproteobacteria bacterium]NIY33560.1 hypothetical protein [Gammaproteobacteria bacterium]
MNDETKSEQQTEAQKEELAVYEKLRQRMRTLLTEARETITADTVS